VGGPADKRIEEILVDAYGEREQLWSFRQAFEDDARFPFRGQIVGADVDVTEVDFEGDERRGLIAVCRRDGERYTVSLLDVVPVGPVTAETRLLMEAYRRWCGAEPLPAAVGDISGVERWVYPRFARVDIDAGPPLALVPMGDWDPAEEYWGEEGDPLHPLEQEVIAAGPRALFQMEQVLPGVADDDWDSDPIVDAADLHRAGFDRDAIRLLDGLLAQDRRCVDAWAHRGLIAFDSRGPGAALEFYETGVAIAERSLPDSFNGVLSRGLVDNRPFLRCLHGLGLCAWRQRRWDDAEAIFTALVWLDPTGSMNALACLEPVHARQRWSRG
jgi:hypothetical protein